MYRLTFCLVCSLFAATPVMAQEPAIDVQHYAFHLTLSDASDAITGEAFVTLRFRDGQAIPFSLDLIGQTMLGRTGMKVEHVKQNNQTVPFSHEDDKLEITPHMTSGEYTFAIQYSGVPADGLIIDENKFGERTFFGDNWPNRARHWLPTVDHPSDKATVEFIVTAPAHYQVVGNGLLIEEMDIGDEMRRAHWRTDVPIPTKVTVIGAARFAVQHAGDFIGKHGSTPLQHWVYPQDRDAGLRDFAVTDAVMAFFESNIGPFPYEKLANVQSKTRYGGMENASNIFYSENAIASGRSNEGLVAHEIAHQWFGDSVTEVDWQHIWLSEGFATYFTQLYMEDTYGSERLKEGMANARKSVLSFYERKPDVPIVNPSITDPNQHLNANSYQKGGWVLHMLRHRVGDDAFWEGIRSYYQTYRDLNASSDDLQKKMEEASGQDLSTFFEQWLYQPGQPMLEGNWAYRNGKVTINLVQTQKTGFFNFPLDIAFEHEDGSVRIETVNVEGTPATFSFDGAQAPSDVILDPEVWLLAGFEFQKKGP